MSSLSRWRDSGHLERAVATAGGQEAFDAAVAAMLDDARGWRLAEMRKRRGMTQEQVAIRMGVSVARVSPDRTRRRFHPGCPEPLRLRPRGHPQAHRRLRRRAVQDRLNGRPPALSQAPAATTSTSVPPMEYSRRLTDQPTTTGSDVSEFRLCILMRRPASLFATSSATKDKRLSTEICLLDSQLPNRYSPVQPSSGCAQPPRSRDSVLSLRQITTRCMP
jgi:hypothetical protein